MSMSEIIIHESRNLSASELKDQVNLIQHVMNAVMIDGVHYGKIPGCGDKPALLKPGAEKIASTFRFAIDPQVEDLSTEDHCRFRIRAVVTHQITGQFLGTGIGEASGAEIKYAWRAAEGQGEFNDTAETRRRLKWKGQSTTMQVRTNQADIANTVLKMAKKRALVDAVLTVTAASDCFSQDLEEMDEATRKAVVGSDADKKTESHKSEPEGPVISEAQAKRAYVIATKECGFSSGQYHAALKAAGFESDREIPKSKYEAFVAGFQKAAKA